MKWAWAEGAPAVVCWCSSTHLGAASVTRGPSARLCGRKHVSASFWRLLHVWTGLHNPFLDTPFLDSLISVAPFHRRNIHGATIITSICSL